MAKKKRADRVAVRRERAFADSQRRFSRRRTVIGLLGFVPLAVALGCGAAPGPFEALCAIPREYLLLLWAALFGSFLGLTIRIVLERRRFARGTWGRSA